MAFAATPDVDAWGPDDEPIPEREGIDGLIDRAETAEDQLAALLVHHSEHHAPCEWQHLEPPRVAEGPLLGQRPGAAETGEDRESSSGTAKARRPVGSAPTAPESLDEKRLAVALRTVMAEPSTGDAIFAVGRGKWDEFAERVAREYRAWHPVTPSNVGGSDG